MNRFLLYSALTISALCTGLLHEHLTTYSNTPNLQADAVYYAEALGKDTPPVPFTQDGCTFFPNRLPRHDFRQACLQHDTAYWLGGTTEERLAADVAFRDTISHTGVIGPAVAYIMYFSSRALGNSQFTKALGMDWGYGWK